MVSRIRAAFFHAELGGDGCWEWKGHRSHNGYGRVRYGKSVVGAHRLAYESFYGPIPPGLTIDHLCRNRACVRPSHLEAVTNRENVVRGVGPTAQNAARTHCKKGHPFDMAINRTKGDRAGTIERSCRTCRNLVYAENPEYREKCKARARAQKIRNKARRAELAAQVPPGGVVMLKLFALVVLFLLPVAAFAQAIEAPPAPQAFPWEGMAVNLITGLQVVLVPLAVQGLKKYVLPRVPRIAFPILAVVLGVAADALATWMGGGGFDALRGALAGLVSVAVHELWTTVRDHGLTGK